MDQVPDLDQEPEPKLSKSDPESEPQLIVTIPQHSYKPYP